MNPEFDGAFAPGVVRGARSFGVDKEGRLTGVVFHQALWYPGVNHAECLKGRENDPYLIRAFLTQMTAAWTSSAHLLPAPEQPHEFETCHCGFYGYYDGSNDYRHRVNTRVSGVVEGFGETLIGTRGFRCSKARIVALTIHDPTITDRIRDHYWDIPAFPSFDAMAAEFPPDKGEA